MSHLSSPSFFLFFNYISILTLQVLWAYIKPSSFLFHGIPECVNEWVSAPLFPVPFLGLVIFCLFHSILIHLFLFYLTILYFIINPLSAYLFSKERQKGVDLYEKEGWEE